MVHAKMLRLELLNLKADLEREPLIDCEEDRALRAVLVGMLRVTDR